jgi:uncharacterized protein
MSAMSSIDQQFVEYIVKSLVNKPDAVQVDRRIDEKGVLLELTVDPEDLGRVIGKRGATAQSLRTLLRALGTKNDARYNLKIVDNGIERPAPHHDDQSGYHSEPMNVSQDDSSSDDNMTSAPSSAQDDVQADSDADDHTDFNAPEDTLSVDHETVVSKTRKELEDLDDLDV